jgi:hypothetical protein
MITINDRRLRLDKVDSGGSVTLRHQGRLHHIGIGRAYAGWRVAMLIEGLDIEVLGLPQGVARHRPQSGHRAGRAGLFPGIRCHPWGSRLDAD